MIGLGMISGTFADALARIDQPIKLKGVLSTRQSTADAFLKEHFTGSTQPPIIYPDVTAIATDDEIDFVIITTPPNAREAIVRVLAEAGKPILMEKPIERTLDAATQLCQLCASHNIPLGIVLQHRTRPSTYNLHDLLKTGAAGALQSVEIAVPWWREQSYYDEVGRGSYERDGGGVMLTQAIHILDLALQFTGPVKDVIALCTRTTAHTMEAEDFVSGGLRFANGAVGSVFCSTASFPGRTQHIALHYENLSATLESDLLTVNWRDGRSETFGTSAASGAGADPTAFKSDWHRFIIENFMSVLVGDAELLASGESAIPVHALIEALEQSGRSGQREVVKTIGKVT